MQVKLKRVKAGLYQGKNCVTIKKEGKDWVYYVNGRSAGIFRTLSLAEVKYYRENSR